MSATLLISWAGFHPDFLAQSSQKGEPVSGEKCQRTISRTCPSSWVWALWIAEAATGDSAIKEWGDQACVGTAAGVAFWAAGDAKYLSIVPWLGGRVSSEKRIIAIADPNTIG